MQKLARKGCPELEYFTYKRRKEAFTSHRPELTDAVLLAAEGSTVRVQNQDAARPMKGIIRDADLSFSDFMEAHPVLVNKMLQLGAKPDLVASLGLFFYRISLHPSRAKPCGERALMHYVAHVRQLWHAQFSQPTIFNISIINEAKLEQIRLDLMDQQRADRFAW